MGVSRGKPTAVVTAKPRAAPKGNTTAKGASPAGQIHVKAHTRAAPKPAPRPKPNVSAPKASPAGQIPQPKPQPKPVIAPAVAAKGRNGTGNQAAPKPRASGNVNVGRGKRTRGSTNVKVGVGTHQGSGTGLLSQARDVPVLGALLGPQTDVVAKGIKNTPKDALNLAANALPSAYHLATTAVTRPKVALKELAQPYVHIYKDPEDALKHPLNTGLLLSGLKAGFGRGAGVGLRAVGKASLERAPKTLEGTSIEVRRQYSRDAFNNAAQKATERVRANKAKKLRTRAAATSNPDEKAALLDKAATVTRTHVTAKELRRREDERTDANNTVARGNRNQATRKVDELKAEKHGPLVPLVAQRIVKPTVKDIRKYRDELVAQQPKLKHSRLRQNRKNVKAINKQLAGKGPDLAAVAAKADAYVRLSKPGQKAIGKAGILAPEQIERRALMPYAVRNMGAHHNGDELAVGVGHPEELLAARRALAAAKATRTKVVARETGPRILKGRTKTDATKAREDFPSANATERATKAETRRALDMIDREQPVPPEVVARLEREGLVIAPEHHTQLTDHPVLTPEGHAERKFALANAPRKVITPTEMAERKVATAQARVDALKGRPLSNKEIRAHMEANGVGEPAFITHGPNRRGARNYFKSDTRPVQVQKAKFTGEATRTGTFDTHPETLRENVANTQTLADQQAGYKARLHEVAYKTKGNQPTQFVKRGGENGADAAKDALESKPGGIKWRVVRTNPFGGSNAQLEELMRPDEAPVHHTIAEALKGNGKGPFSLIPEETAARMEQHLALLGSGTGKAFQKFTGTFRKAVLATNPKWLFGNDFEGGLRATIMRAGPTSYAIGKKVLAELDRIDPEAAKEMRARMGGGHYTMADRMDLHRASEQFAHTDMEPYARALGAFWRAPGPKQAAGLWHAYTNFVFHTVNGKAEFGIQTAMLGKALSKSPLMTGKLMKLSEAAVNDAAKGLTNTNNQVMLVREIHRAYGKYNAYRPSVKRAISTYTPFLPWTLNALHFMLWVLPKDHPILTGALVAANQASQDWLKTQGLDLNGPGALPPFLQGSIPFKGGHVLASHYTPAGAFTDLPGTLAGSVLPQAQGALAAGLYGTDWKGKKLKDQTSTGRAKAGLMSLVEAVIPGYGQGQSIKGHGLQGLNPLRPVGAVKTVKGGLPQSVLDSLGGPDIGTSLTQKQLDALGGP